MPADTKRKRAQRRRQRAKLTKTLFENMGASKVADTRAHKRACHLNGTATKQKDEGAASTGCRKALLPGGE